MGNLKHFDNMMDEKIKEIHTAYLAKIISVSPDETTAKIQPLGKTKEYGGEEKEQTPLSNVPIIESARNHVKRETITYVTEVSGHVGIQETKDFAILRKLEPGDVVIVVCCERNITDAKNGVNSVPVIGHHSMSDSIIVGIV